MRQYETVFIFRPDLSDDQVDSTVEKVTSRLESLGGKPVSINHWGVRRLAYTINYRAENFKNGNYLVLNFLGDGKAVDSLDRMTKLMDEVIRTQTIKLDEDVDPATITEIKITREEQPEPEPSRSERYEPELEGDSEAEPLEQEAETDDKAVEPEGSTEEEPEESSEEVEEKNEEETGD